MINNNNINNNNLNNFNEENNPNLSYNKIYKQFDHLRHC